MIHFINKSRVGCHGGIRSVSRVPARETPLRPGRCDFSPGLSRVNHIWVCCFLFNAFGVRGEGKKTPHPPPCCAPLRSVLIRMLPLLFSAKVALMSCDLIPCKRANFQPTTNFRGRGSNQSVTDRLIVAADPVRVFLSALTDSNPPRFFFPPREMISEVTEPRLTGSLFCLITDSFTKITSFF